MGTNVEKVVSANVVFDGRTTLDLFVARYYAHVDPKDLLKRQPADLYGAARSHWSFARKRNPGHARLRVFNPTIEDHGWESTHTIIEIVNDNMPFLVESLSMEVNRHGLTLHLIIHPIVPVVRAVDGTLTGIAPNGETATQTESFIHIEIDRMTDPVALEGLAADTARVLADVRAVVDDWTKMVEKERQIAAEAEKSSPPLSVDEISEGIAFVAWLADDHFTFLGYRRRDLVVREGQSALQIVPGSNLGILRESPGHEAPASSSALLPKVKAYTRRPHLLVINKSTLRSTVHRPGYLDYIAVNCFNTKGEVSGEHQFLGLFTSAAYNANPADIPLVRRKIANVIRRAHLPPRGQAEEALVNILENYPRDELFQISENELLRIAMGILHLGKRQRFRIFVRRDPFQRFLSCLIYAPRETFTTELQHKWQTLLMNAFNGTSCSSTVHLSEAALARVHILVRTTPGKIPPFDVRALEKAGQELSAVTPQTVQGTLLPDSAAEAAVERLPAWVRDCQVTEFVRAEFKIPAMESYDELAHFVCEGQPPPIRARFLRPELAEIDITKLMVIGLYPSGAVRTVGVVSCGDHGSAMLVVFNYWSLLDPDDAAQVAAPRTQTVGHVDLFAVSLD